MRGQPSRVPKRLQTHNPAPPLAEDRPGIRQDGWGGRNRTYKWRGQSPLPYRLATPQGIRPRTLDQNRLRQQGRNARLVAKNYLRAAAKSEATAARRVPPTNHFETA